MKKYGDDSENDELYIDDKNNEIGTSLIVLAEKTPNMIFNYNPYFLVSNNFQFNPKRENIVFCITNEGYLAYFTSADFGNIPKNVKKYNFQMRIHKEKLKSQEELEKLLGI